MPYFADAYAVKAGEAGAYPHVFGGAPRFASPNPFAAKAAPHLLDELDMADPCLHGLPFERSGSIQLIHPFRYDGASLAYESRSNGALALGAEHAGWRANYDATNADPMEGRPYADYAETFPSGPITLEKLPGKSVLHATPNMPMLVVGELVDDLDQTPDAVAIEDLPNIENTLDELCPNASCRQRIGAPQPMRLFAIVPNFPVSDLSLWGECGEYVWVVFCVCPQCCTILTCNITD